MKPTIKLTSSGPGAKAVIDGLKMLTESQVYVGVPEKDAARKKDPVTNAQLVFLHTHGVRSADMRDIMDTAQTKKYLPYPKALALYLHTHGSPLWQVPPRPIIEPAIEDKQNRTMIEAELKLAAQAALDGNKAEVNKRLKLAGILAQSLVRAWFTNPRNNWAPNAPSTIKRKGSDKPLIDRGELRKSITYVVVESK